MPQHSQDVAQDGQSNQNLSRAQKGASPGCGSGSARFVVVPRQAGQGGDWDVAIIMIVVCSIPMTV